MGCVAAEPNPNSSLGTAARGWEISPLFAFHSEMGCMAQVGNRKTKKRRFDVYIAESLSSPVASASPPNA